MATETKEIMKVFTGVVKTKAEAENGWTVEVEFSKLSKFPTRVNRIPKADADQLVIGQACSLTLARGKLKQSQDGSSKTGQYENDYFWNYHGLATPASLQEETAEPTVRNQRQPAMSTDESIRRQVALKAAVETVAQGLDWEQIVATAHQYSLWLANPDSLASALAEPADRPAAPLSAPVSNATPRAAPELAPKRSATGPGARITAAYALLGWPPAECNAFSMEAMRKATGLDKPRWGAMTPDQQEAVAQAVEAAADNKYKE